MCVCGCVCVCAGVCVFVFVSNTVTKGQSCFNTVDAHDRKARGSGPHGSPLPTKLLLSWGGIQADRLDVPAKRAAPVHPQRCCFALAKNRL